MFKVCHPGDDVLILLLQVIRRESNARVGR